jgi:hypothetical protein
MDTGRRTLDTWTLRRPHRAPDTGRVDTGHLDAQTPAPDTGHRSRGHWTLAPDTGRRTLAEDADRVTTARPASGPTGLTSRVTARWDA